MKTKSTKNQTLVRRGDIHPMIAAIPSEQIVAKAAASLDDVETMLGASAASLSTKERRRSLKFRKGGEPMVSLLAELALRYGVQIPGVDPATMQSNIALAQRIQPLDTKMRAVTKLVSDTLLLAKSEAWQGTTSLYTALARASARMPSLEAELAPAVAFFSIKAKKRVTKPSAGGSPDKAADAGSQAPTPIANGAVAVTH